MRRNFRDAQSSLIASSSYRCHDVIVTSSLACAREIAFGQTYRVTMNAHVGLRAARGGREAPYAVKISITLDLQALRHVTNRISTSRALRGSYDKNLRIKWLNGLLACPMKNCHVFDKLISHVTNWLFLAEKDNIQFSVQLTRVKAFKLAEN